MSGPSERSKEDEDFLNELRQNSLLKREEAFVSLNAELEKKTSAILEEIERYSALRKNQKEILPTSTANTNDDKGGGGDSNANDSPKPYNGLSSSASLDNFAKKFSSSYDRYQDLLDTKRLLVRNETPPPQPLSVRGVSSLQSLSPKIRTESRSDSPSFHEGPGGSLEDAFADSTSEILDERDRKQRVKLQKAKDSVINCLQSKLCNYETRIKDLHLQYRQKMQENTILGTRIKALEEDRERLLRSVTSLQSSLDKQVKQLDSCKSNANTKSHAVDILRKEVETLKREKKQSDCQAQTLLTRLNRVTEENDKLKGQIKSLNLHIREVQADNRLRLEEHSQKIVSLEQERNTLSSTVTKQAHLLKNLTHQKVILENIITRSSPSRIIDRGVRGSDKIQGTDVTNGTTVVFVQGKTPLNSSSSS